MDAISTHFDTLSANIAKFQETVRVGVMERLDRQQDEQTKLRLELAAAVQLSDTAPTELLVRIMQLQDEVRELKEEKKNRQSPGQGEGSHFVHLSTPFMMVASLPALSAWNRCA